MLENWISIPSNQTFLSPSFFRTTSSGYGYRDAPIVDNECSSSFWRIINKSCCLHHVQLKRKIIAFSLFWKWRSILSSVCFHELGTSYTLPQFLSFIHFYYTTFFFHYNFDSGFSFYLKYYIFDVLNDFIFNLGLIFPTIQWIIVFLVLNFFQLFKILNFSNLLGSFLVI